MGYDEFEADYILTLQDIKIRDEERDLQIDTLMDLFKAGAIDQVELIARLDAMALNSAYRNRLVARALREREQQTRLPSKEDLLRWLERRIISREEFADYMEKLGYRSADIEKYLREVG